MTRPGLWPSLALAAPGRQRRRPAVSEAFGGWGVTARLAEPGGVEVIASAP